MKDQSIEPLVANHQHQVITAVTAACLLEQQTA
jgi:hypothetical protein